MSELRQVIQFASALYRARLDTAYAAYVKRDPVSLLWLRIGKGTPYPIYERLRARGTLTPTRNGHWVTTSYRVCDSVLRDRRFGVHPDGGAPSGGGALSFLSMNPPDHTRLRRIATPTFGPKAVATYRARIERTVGDLLDRAEETGEFDLVSGFAEPLPVAVITDLFGFPESDLADFVRLGEVIPSALQGIRSLRHARELQASNMELRQRFADLIELRRSAPGDDIISRLIEAEGEQLKPDEMLSMCVLLLVAGFAATVDLVGSSVLALSAHPDQWQAFCADPESMAAKVVEETLRFDSPVQLVIRHALQPLELEGKAIKKNQMVITLLGAANRDPEVYPHPNTFDINREGAAPHLAFSGGLHYCLGQPLARLEATTALQLLAERMTRLSVKGSSGHRTGSSVRRRTGKIRVTADASGIADRARSGVTVT
jgi:cytochrome P450